MKVLKGISILALAALIAVPADAAQHSDGRRTLSLLVDQKAFVFEAPLGMCFLSGTNQQEAGLIEFFREQAEGRGGQVMLAAFASCDAVSGLPSGSNATGEDIRYNAGTISWLNPLIGPETRMPRSDYLDMRESALVSYADTSPLRAPGLVPNRESHRTENGVSVAMLGDIEIEGIKKRGSSVLATTAVRGMPFEFTMQYSGAGAPTEEKIYALADKFMAQQIALNE